MNLGVEYKSSESRFTLWTQDAEQVYLELEDPSTQTRCEYLAKAIGDDVYEVVVAGDQKGKKYRYSIKRNERYLTVVDPFARALSPPSDWGIVIDGSQTNPKGYKAHKRPHLPYQEAIIYEAHVRDMSVDPKVPFAHPGTFWQLSEDVTYRGQALGLAYLKELGVTHLHLLPVMDFLTVHEYGSGYNWGYDPEFFFALEPSYGAHNDPHRLICEFKTLVQKTHEYGMGIVLDVVYNHTFRTEDSVYEKIAPGYFYRMDSQCKIFGNGSGCGNEVDTKKPMVQKIIRESLFYFLEEMKVDGFRFDLMGLMDLEFTKSLIEDLRKKHPQVLIYGEPWTGGPSLLEPEEQTRKGSQCNEHFSVFNDHFRDAIRGGNDDSTKGYVQGNVLARTQVLCGITGSITFSQGIESFACEPWESINYHTSHDNLILYDKLVKSTQASAEKMLAMQKLAFSIELLSFGIPFLHEGTEMMRSKQMLENTYNAGDEVNRVNWDLVLENRELVEHVKSLISLRKRLAVFSQYDAATIRERLRFFYSAHEILFTIELEEDAYETVLIAHNNQDHSIAFELPEGEWERLFGEGPLEELRPMSTSVLAKQRRIK